MRFSVILVLLFMYPNHSRSEIEKPFPVLPELVLLGGHELINVERNCADSGESVGRLEYRVWRDGDGLIARCDLNKPINLMVYTITWKVRDERGSRRVLNLCEFTKPRNISDEISCELRLKLPRAQDGERISCWVRSVNEWGTESATSCASDEIVLMESVYRTWKENITRQQKAKDRVLLENPFTREETRRRLHPSYKHDRYVVEIAPYNNTLKCNDRGHLSLLSFSVVPVLNVRPHSITWNCSMVFHDKRSDNYTLQLIKGNSSDPYYNFGIYLKQCKSQRQEYSRGLECSATMPIINDDIGTNVFYCKFTDEPYKCITDKAYYNISTVDQYNARMRRLAEEAAERERERIRRLGMPNYHGKRDRSITNRTFLPWNSGPMVGPGVRLNGSQYIVMGTGATAGLASIGCLAAMIVTTLRKRKEAKNAELCYCNRDKPKGESDEEEEQAKRKTAKDNGKARRG